MSGDIYVSFGAETGALESAFALAKAESRALSAEMSKVAREMQRAGAAADSDMGHKLTSLGGALAEAKAHMAELSHEMHAHKEEAGSTSEKIAELRESMMRLAEIAGIGLGIDAFKEWVSGSTEAAEKIDRLSHQLGASTGEVQTFGGIAKMTGTDFDAMAVQLERLQLNLARTTSTMTPAVAGLKALGLNAQEFRRLSIPKQFEELAAAVSKFQDGAAKTAAVQALGRGFVELLPVLDRGREGLREIDDAIERTGAVMSGAMVERFAATRDHLNELSLAAQGFSQRLFSVLQPAIDAAIQGLTRLVEAANPELLRSYLVQIADALIDAAASIATFAVNAGVEWDKLGEKIMGWVGPIIDAGNRIAGALNAINSAASATKFRDPSSSGEFVGDAGSPSSPSSVPALDSSGALLNSTIAHADALHRIGAEADAAKAKVRELFAVGAETPGAKGGEGAASLPQVPEMQIGGARKGGKGASHAANDAFRSSVDDARNAARDQADILNGELKLHQITMDQWLTQSRAALEAEKTAVKHAADQAVASQALSSQQKQQILEREKQAVTEIARQERALWLKQAEDIQKQYESAFGQIDSLFSSQLSGLISGTTTFRQAMGNMLKSLTQELAQFFLRWGVMQIEHYAEARALEASGVAAHLAGNAAKTASDQAAGATGLAMMIGNAVRAVTVDAGQTFGGIFAFLAPFMGPAAAGPAAAGAGAVMAAASFDIGAWSIPTDQLAMVHKNELVMPAAEAGAFRTMLSGAVAGRGSPGPAGAVTHHHTWNIGGSSDPRETARQVARVWNREPSLRPVY